MKGVPPRDLKELGATLVLSNTYHLYLRPGDELIARQGGLHRFMGWDGPMLTDDGHIPLRAEPGIGIAAKADAQKDGRICQAVPKFVLDLSEHVRQPQLACDQPIHQVEQQPEDEAGRNEPQPGAVRPRSDKRETGED